MTEPSPTISGVVLDGEGRPLPEARVYFVEGPGPLPDVAALTDAKGRFQMVVPGAGRYLLEVAADGPDGTIRQSIGLAVDGRRVRRVLDVRLDELG